MKKLFCLLLISVLLAGCQSEPITGETVATDGGSYQQLTALELRAMLKNKDFVLINVHIPFAGNIADTDLSIPYDQIEDNLSQFPSDKTARIVLYCRSGHMSQIAAENLVSLGYTNIWDLQGGMAGWEQEGFDLKK
jgi:rhodanese-related sulfurtransferase